MLYETENTAFLVDCGIGFPAAFTPGVNVMVPDLRALESVSHKLQAFVLTHGHEDHVGAVTHLFKSHRLPIYATPFTQGIVRQKLKEAGIEGVTIRDLHCGKTIQIGDFSLEPVFVNHSILDTVALFIKGHDRTVMHLTDFKIDRLAPEGKITDLDRFTQIGADGLDLLLMDSTNALSEGWTQSELTIKDNLLQHFRNISSRLIVCLFSSNVIRLQHLIECARVTGRAVAFTGRSTKEYVEIARNIGRFATSGVKIVDVEEIHGFADSEVLVVATGSQAEPRSVLSRMSEDAFKPFRLREGDVVLMSSKMIPGNEGDILAMMNRLTQLGATVIFDDDALPIHASGHAKRDELRAVFAALKPKYFIPIHGSYMHLQSHVELAAECGVLHKNSRITLNGETVALGDDGLSQIDTKPTGHIFLTSNNLVIDAEAVRLRRKMAFEGLVAVSVLYAAWQNHKLHLEIASYGVIGAEREDLACFELKEKFLRELKSMGDEDPEKIKKWIKTETRKFFRDRFHMRPEVIVLLHEV